MVKPRQVSWRRVIENVRDAREDINESDILRNSPADCGVGSEVMYIMINYIFV